MVTMTVYANADIFCFVVNTLNKAIKHEYTSNAIKEVSLIKSRKFPYELQVPIKIIGQFTKKNMTTINLYKLQNLTAT